MPLLKCSLYFSKGNLNQRILLLTGVALLQSFIHQSQGDDIKLNCVCPPPLTHGYHACDGVTITYTCFEEYTLSGQVERRCGVNETWLGLPPTCSLKSRDHEQPITIKGLTISEDTIKQIVTYASLAGLILALVILCCIPVAVILYKWRRFIYRSAAAMCSCMTSTNTSNGNSFKNGSDNKNENNLALMTAEEEKMVMRSMQ